jgi:cytochrome c oxidase subunit IV
MSAEDTNEHLEHAEEHEGMTRKKIWQVFFYLLGITAFEFFIALFLLPKGFIGQGIANFAYIVLTLVKAFYIIAYFMHLKFERLALKTVLTVSLIFIVYFIILMLTEGSYLGVHMN